VCILRGFYPISNDGSETSSYESQELDPRIVEVLSHLLLVFLWYSCMLQRIQAKLFQVRQVEIPGDVGYDVVQGNTWAVEEARVIRANGDCHTTAEQATNRVRAQVMTVAEKQVGGRTAFNADIAFLNDFDKVWVHDKVEAMTDALGAKEHCIKKLGIVAARALACMEVKLKVFTPALLKLQLVLNQQV
jgi:hypothetical protein